MIQIAPTATSPILTNTSLYPNTFRPIVSALGFVNFQLSLIKRKNYQYIGALYEIGRAFQSTVYAHFARSVVEKGVVLTSFGLFDDHIPLKEFRSRIRIIFVFASTNYSGVGSIRALRGPQIQAVGVALIIEFCDHNVPFLKVIF